MIYQKINNKFIELQTYVVKYDDGYLAGINIEKFIQCNLKFRDIFVTVCPLTIPMFFKLQKETGKSPDELILWAEEILTFLNKVKTIIETLSQTNKNKF